MFATGSLPAGQFNSRHLPFLGFGDVSKAGSHDSEDLTFVSSTRQAWAVIHSVSEGRKGAEDLSKKCADYKEEPVSFEPLHTH